MLVESCRNVVNAKSQSHVLRKYSPLLRMLTFGCVFPIPVATQMAFVLSFKQISVNIEEPFKRAACNRVSVSIQILLIVKPKFIYFHLISESKTPDFSGAEVKLSQVY